jgi:hypothetical protein
VILAGRCVKDINHEDARSFRTTANGYMICNQTLSVNTGRNQADLFNFYAINSSEDKFNQHFFGTANKKMLKSFDEAMELVN